MPEEKTWQEKLKAEPCDCAGEVRPDLLEEKGGQIRMTRAYMNALWGRPLNEDMPLTGVGEGSMWQEARRISGIVGRGIGGVESHHLNRSYSEGIKPALEEIHGRSSFVRGEFWITYGSRA